MEIFDGNILIEEVKKRFYNMSGMDKNSDGWINIEKIEKEILKKYFAHVRVKYNIKVEDISFENRKISFADYTCNLSFLNDRDIRKIKKAAVYILTLDNLNLEKITDPLEQVYADIIGTAFIDVAVKKIKEEIKKKYSFCVSESFGPGYYELPINDMIEIHRISDGSSLGINVREDGLLMPEKSTAGFFLLSEEKLNIPKECKTCKGQVQSCSLCNIKKVKK